MISIIFMDRINKTNNLDDLFLEANIIIRVIHDSLTRGELKYIMENIEKLEYIILRIDNLSNKKRVPKND